MNAHTKVVPDAPEQAAEPRARIVAAMHRRGEGDSPPLLFKGGDRGVVADAAASGGQGAPSLHHPHTPSSKEDGASNSDLPTLIAVLPTDDTRAPQDRFTRDVQREFLEALSIVGSVRDAARRVGVSHMTAYRARRKCAAFRRCWDAAVVLAIPHAEEELACRAIDGVEEDVMYRGEVVHTRIRKDARLLLAHLGRLDRKAAQPQAAALAECFDDALEALGRGEDLPETATGIPAPVSPSGQCNRCNTSPAQYATAGAANGADDFRRSAPDPLDKPCDCPGAVHGIDRGRRHYRNGPQGPEPVPNVDGSGPCCDDPRWPQCRDCPHYPPVARVLAEMEEARPADAPAPGDLGDPSEVEDCQMQAFESGDADWWRYGADFVLHECGQLGYWQPVAGALAEDDLPEDAEGVEDAEDAEEGAIPQGIEKV